MKLVLIFLIIAIAITAIALFIGYISGVETIGRIEISDKSLPLVLEELNHPCSRLFDDGSKSIHLNRCNKLQASYIATWTWYYPYYIYTKYGYYNVPFYSKMAKEIKHKLKEMKRRQKPKQPVF